MPSFLTISRRTVRDYYPGRGKTWSRLRMFRRLCLNWSSLATEVEDA